MTSLKYKAQMALEGSDRSETALAQVRDYIDDLNDRTLTGVTNVDLNTELGALLRTLRQLADPDGSSAYRLEIVPRRSVGRPPNPALKRIRGHSAMFAALYADRLLKRNPAMQKKQANSVAAETLGVTIGEVHAARKSTEYHELRDWNLEQAVEQAAEK